MLIYFDLFGFPLRKDELSHATNTPVEDAIRQLAEQGLIHCCGEHYQMRKNEEIIKGRIEKTQLASKLFRRAKKYARIMRLFPFVEGIYISGSLSKGIADATSDIDYFIITRPGRLWICRTMLILFKKIFLFNSKRFFCVNYFIDSQMLEVPDKNAFTASEIIFLKPLYNYELFLRFAEANAWVKDYYPGWQSSPGKFLIGNTAPSMRRVSEWLLGGRFGEWLDSVAFRMTLAQWKRKFRAFDEDAFDLNLRSRKNVSKHHPSGFQTTTLQKYHAAIAAFESETGIKLALHE